MERLHAIISGRVQGVSFRYYTVMEANRLAITGWVMNRADNRVEVLAEGTHEQLQALESWLHRGSPDAEVSEVDSQWLTATGEFSTFEVKYNLR